MAAVKDSQSPDQGWWRPNGRLGRWGALMSVSLATVLVLIDFMAVSVALPAVALPAARGGLGASFAELQWVLEAFVLGLAAFVLTAGYIADVVGRPVVFLTGLAALAVASLFAGSAHSPYVLIGARVVQGLGAAMLFATGPALLTKTFQSKGSRAALVAWGTITGLGVAASPVVGGLITSQWGWRWVLYINAPVAVVALVLGAAWVREPAPARAATGPGNGTGAYDGRSSDNRPAPQRPDWLGLGLFTAAIAILVAGLVSTTTSSSLGVWAHSGVVACFFSTAILLVAFVAVETVAPAPMIDISLFRRRTPRSVHYTLHVPEGARIDKINLVNGSLDVQKITGEINANLVNGKVRASDLTGEADLATVNGAIEANYNSLKNVSRIKLKSVNGSVNLTLPPSPNADIDASVVNGSITTEFPLP